MLKEGDKAPDFTTKDQDGNAVKLSDFKGKKVVLYFYPKDDTPGGTKEACSFRDAYAAYNKKGKDHTKNSSQNINYHSICLPIRRRK